MEIKIQTTIRGEAAELFAASMEHNHRTAAGEAAFRIEKSLANDKVRWLAAMEHTNTVSTGDNARTIYAPNGMTIAPLESEAGRTR